jgi:SAM-dependent methyltransferase
MLWPNLIEEKKGLRMNEFERWQKRYTSAEYLFGEEPNYFLASCRDILPASGRALAVADGESRNGVWLAEQGLDVVSVEFSPPAIKKAAALAKKRGVEIEIIEADVHTWDYPAEEFDVVVEIFTQFSTPDEREQKWAGMKKALKPGGLIIIQGYQPKQLEYGTGGPKQLENLYTREMLEEAFSGFKEIEITEDDLEMREGIAHGGMSAVICFTARK